MAEESWENYDGVEATDAPAVSEAEPNAEIVKAEEEKQDVEGEAAPEERVEEGEGKAEEAAEKENEEKEEEKAPEPSSSSSSSSSSSKVDEEEGDGLTRKERKEMEQALEKEKARTEIDDDHRTHLNLVFIGHVDAGKSTLCGQILYSTGQVDARTIEKYEREAKEKNRQSWFLAYIMDTNEEERAKGKTVECGRAVFATDKKRYTILDAPGHKNYVPNMIMGAAQADVGILVVSARKGEFETGFDKGGQTREHAMLAKTLGVRQIIVLVNKMDDCNWSQERFDFIQSKISPYLRSLGFNLKNHVKFLPASGFTGEGIAKPIDNPNCKWYSSGHLLDVLDGLSEQGRKDDDPIRFPILDRYKDAGATTVIGKLESGKLEVGQQVVIMPMEKKAEITGLLTWEQAATVARAGENVTISLKGINLEDVQPGFVICSVDSLCKAVRVIDAQLVMMNLRTVFAAGYQSVLHLHTAVEECTVRGLLTITDKKTKVVHKKPRFLQNGDVATVRLQVPQNVCVELFSDYPQLGRFTLRDEGKTIAIGKVIDLPTLRKKAQQ